MYTLFVVGAVCIFTPLKKAFSPIIENSPSCILRKNSSALCFVLSSLALISIVIRVNTLAVFNEISPSVYKTA